MTPDEQGIRKNLHRYQVIPRVLCFVLNGDQVLLLKGAPTKRVWPNKYNGLGGHVERDEDILTAVVREVHEESGLTVTNVRLRGVINIDVGEPVGVLLFVFLADTTETDVASSPEGRPEWVALDRLHEYDLVEDVAVILPRALEADAKNTVFFAQYHYNAADEWIITWSQHSAKGMVSIPSPNQPGPR